VSGAWEAVKITIATALEVTDDAILVAQGDKRYRVPGAFVARVTPATTLAKGDPVMASAKGTRVFGRIIDADLGKAHVRFKFAGSVDVAEIAADDLIEIDGSGFLGAPITVRDNKADRSAQLVYLGKERAWVLSGGRAYAVAPTDVTVSPTPVMFAKGAHVVAMRADALTSAVVVEVLDEGLQYKLNWDGGDETATSTFESVLAKKP